MKDFIAKNKWFILGGVGLLTLGITIAFVIDKIRKSGFLKKVLVCSHITNVDADGRTKAENNLKNIQIALDNDIDIIEMDVQITRDGVPVLFHDETLDAKTNGSGRIQDKNWSEVSQLTYNVDSSQGITKFEDAVKLLKKSGKKTIFQLDKCDSSEIAQMDSLGLFNGVKDQMLSKSQSFTKSEEIRKAGILYMPIIPSSYVGKMTSDAIIDEIVEKCKGSDFLEAQFSDLDSKFIDGTLSNKLKKIGCRLLVVAVGGSTYTNGSSFRGDSQKQWAKMIDPMGAGAIMTNYPIKLKDFIKTID
jgi:Glycerophosphoryl diester phosphodiesterase family